MHCMMWSMSRKKTLFHHSEKMAIAFGLMRLHVDVPSFTRVLKWCNNSTSFTKDAHEVCIYML